MLQKVCLMEERHRRLLIRQNPWWRGEKPSLPQFERDLLGELLRYVDYPQILAVVGMRRVGKTTLMKQLIQKLKAPEKNICYISFDDIDFQKYEVADELISYFLEFSDGSTRRYLFLDEVQKLPHWAELLKTYYDSEDNLKMFVSGSASLEIKEYKETLAGRILTFHLPVLTFREFLRYRGMRWQISRENLFREYDLKFAMHREKYQRYFEDYLEKGAFPELLDVEDREFIRRYIKEAVVEKAIADVARITGDDERIIYELFRLLAKSNAQLFEIVNLARILGVNRNKVSKYLSLLEKAFLIRIGYNYSPSVAKQLRKRKKQYISHSCIVMALLDYPREILNTEVAGQLVEACIAGHFEKVNFWRSPQKDEVDLVVDGDGLLAVEVKYRSHISRREIGGLLKFVKRYGAQGVVVTRERLERGQFRGVDVLFIPAWLFLLLDSPA